MSSMRTALCAVLLLVAVAAGAAQAIDCPDLFSSVPAEARDDVVRECTGSAGCDACQCSLAKAITPILVQSGKILSSEAYMPSSLTTIADALTQCKKEFAVQLLENTNTTLTQLSSFDTCSTDVKVVSQCISAKPEAAAAADAAAPQAVASDGTSMAQEVMGEACAASVSGSSNATGCPSQRAAQVMAGAPLMSGGGLIMAPVSDASVLAISPSNTRGSITWRALCWCEETYDPVCDAMTRKQYPNACSAQCQNVTQVVPCTSLEPLVNQTMAGNTAAFVVDQSLTRAAAFNGPMPAEMGDDAQNFYYYYEDDADDTQDSMDIASTLTEALLAARYGAESGAVDAVVKTLPSAVQAGTTVPVKSADGPADNTTAPAAGPLAALRNITVTIQRLGLDRRPQAAPERRNVSVPAVPTGVGMEPANPAWMMTNAPGYSAGVYQRDPERTSRILASLMAAAQDASINATRPAASAAPAAPAAPTAAANVLNRGAAAVGANQTAGDMFRAAEGIIGNMTSALNSTLDAAGMRNMAANATTNGTMNGTAAGPVLRAFEGLAQAPTEAGVGGRFGNLLSMLRGAVQRATAARPQVGALQGQMPAAGILRSAVMDAMDNITMAMNGTMGMNGTMDMNGTSDSTANATQAGSASSTEAGTSRRQAGPKRRLLAY